MVVDRGSYDSWIHRALHIRPGEAPFWLCSRSACAGLDLLKAIALAIPGTGLVIFYDRPAVVWGSMAIMVAFVLAVVVPFERCERKARARRRQQMAELEARQQTSRSTDGEGTQRCQEPLIEPG